MTVTIVQAAAYAGRLQPDEAETLLAGLRQAVVDSTEIAIIWSSSRASPDALAGLIEGFIDGFLEGADHWAADLKRLFHLVGVGTEVALTEFFARPLFEAKPSGLLPQSTQAVSDLQGIKNFAAVVRWLDAVGPETAFNTLRDLIPDASDIGIMIANAVGGWAAELASKAKHPVEVGRHIGRLLGRAVLEFIRAELEPGVWMAGELISAPIGSAEAGTP